MRVDMVERVAALVRAAARAGQFKITDEMMSLAGVSRVQMAQILFDLGCRQVAEEPSDEPEKPAIPVFERMRTKRSTRRHRTADNEAGASSKDNKQGLKSRKSKGNRNQKARGPHDNKTPFRPRPEKQPDPNSPFAVLAALKK